MPLFNRDRAASSPRRPKIPPNPYRSTRIELTDVGGQIINVALLSTTLIIITQCVAKAIAKVPERPELVVYGDVARLPREAVAPGNRGGSSDRPSTTVTRTKDHGSHSMMETGL